MKIVGRAMPVLEADVFDEGSGSPGPLAGKPFGLMLEALDDLRPNEVCVATGSATRTNSDCDAMMPAIRRTLSASNGAAQAVRMSDAYRRDAVRCTAALCVFRIPCASYTIAGQITTHRLMSKPRAW